MFSFRPWLTILFTWAVSEWHIDERFRIFVKPGSLDRIQYTTFTENIAGKNNKRIKIETETTEISLRSRTLPLRSLLVLASHLHLNLVIRPFNMFIVLLNGHLIVPSKHFWKMKMDVHANEKIETATTKILFAVELLHWPSLLWVVASHLRLYVGDTSH